MKIKKQKSSDNRKISHTHNFLVNREFVEGLVDKTSICSQDLVVEIGPGKGIITSILSKKAKKVIGAEYDRDLVSKLNTKFNSDSNVEIVHVDFLEWDLPNEPFKVFSNIPFNITADIVNKLVFPENYMEAAYLIIQEEAAKRFMGAPTAPNTQVSILIQPFYEMNILEKINRNNFVPKPKVDVVLLSIKKRKNPKVSIEKYKLYRDFVIYGYNQWKPTITEAFNKVFSKKQLNIISKEHGLADLKPSELNVDQWVGFFKSFTKYATESGKDEVMGAEERLRLSQKGMEKQHRTRE